MLALATALALGLSLAAERGDTAAIVDTFNATSAICDETAVLIPAKTPWSSCENTSPSWRTA